MIRPLLVAAAFLLAGRAIADEAVLVHDIAPPHPRYTQLFQMVAEVAARTSGQLTIAINPGGRILYPGQASLDAVRSKKVPLTFVNSAFLQSIDPNLGFMNLPFTIDDQVMAIPAVAEGVIGLVQEYVAPSGLRVLAMMRGADTILLFSARQVRKPEELAGLKIRVAGPGVYLDIVRSLGAQPAVFPAIEMGAALARKEIDGIITSPGGWGKNVRDAPNGTLVPGLLFYTYFLLADKSWLDALPAAEREALADAARTTVTQKWQEMRQDDARLVSRLAAGGASYASVPASELPAWKERVAGVTRDFAAAHPEVMKKFLAIAGPTGASVTANAERIHFDSAARDSRVLQIFQGKTEYSDRIYGELQLPSRGAGPFPAMVIMHSSRGIEATITDWARMFNDMGVATFVVDSFTPRGITESSANQLGFPAGVVDSLRALNILQKDPRIDAKSIGVIGFSRGAIAAMSSSFELYRAGVLGVDGAKFALHIPFYGGCAQYAKTTGSPILTFIGTDDDFTSPELCRKHAEILTQQGTKAELVVYEGALHGFDWDSPRQNMPMIQNSRNCRMLQSLDTFDTIMLDGRPVSAEERTRYAKSCVGSGAARGGDRKYASLARERVRLFVAEQFKLQR